MLGNSAESSCEHGSLFARHTNSSRSVSWGSPNRSMEMPDQLPFSSLEMPLFDRQCCTKRTATEHVRFGNHAGNLMYSQYLNCNPYHARRRIRLDTMNRPSESLPDTAGIADRIHSNVFSRPSRYAGCQRSSKQSRRRVEERTKTPKVNPTSRPLLIHSRVHF